MGAVPFLLTIASTDYHAPSYGKGLHSNAAIRTFVPFDRWLHGMPAFNCHQRAGHIALPRDALFDLSCPRPARTSVVEWTEQQLASVSSLYGLPQLDGIDSLKTEGVTYTHRDTRSIDDSVMCSATRHISVIANPDGPPAALLSVYRKSEVCGIRTDAAADSNPSQFTDLQQQLQSKECRIPREKC